MKFHVLVGCCLLVLPACMSPQKKTEAEPSAQASATASPASSLDAPADVAAAPADAQKTPSGLTSRVLTPGTGQAKPTEFDRVKVHYTGWTKDGKRFDSSVERGQPATFGLRQVIKGWTEGVQLMVVGEKRRFWIPGNLAYGETPSRPGAPAGQLTFDVELLEIIEGPKPPPAPEDVAAAPADAKKTKSGLAYKVLKEGTGKDHPAAASRVRVHYTGWTTDGKMFDSSIMNGRPLTMSLDRVIKGWTEGLQLMVEGEKTRFWIPGELGYGEKPEREGAPAGTLVFDIELLNVLPDGAAGMGHASPHGSAPRRASPGTVPTRKAPPTPTAH
jgi:FKBP-type peptidyl-prolyl cis-trans isomerase